MTAARMHRRHALATLLLPSLARAQSTERPVKLVVPYAAGGTFDQMGRFVAQGLQERAGGTWVVDNRTGAGGLIAAASAARARPDGETLFLAAWAQLVAAPHLSRDPGFDPHTAFDFIGGVGNIHLMLVVRPDLGVNSFADFIAMAKASGGRLNFGTAGAGSMAHLATELFCKDFGFTATHVAFRGLAQVVTEMLAGRIDFMLDALLGVQFVRDGKLKGLGVTGQQRWPGVPGVPSFRELGRPDLDRYISPIVLLAPAGMAAAPLAQLRRWTRELMATEDMQRKVWGIAFEPAYTEPEPLRRQLGEDWRTFGRVIRELGLEAGN